MYQSVAPTNIPGVSGVTKTGYYVSSLFIKWFKQSRARQGQSENIKGETRKGWEANYRRGQTERNDVMVQYHNKDTNIRTRIGNLNFCFTFEGFSFRNPTGHSTKIPTNFSRTGNSLIRKSKSNLTQSRPKIGRDYIRQIFPEVCLEWRVCVVVSWDSVFSREAVSRRMGHRLS